MTRIWFKPLYSHFWHLPDKKGVAGRCGGWIIRDTDRRESRSDDAPGNCPACLRLISESESK